MHYDIKLENNNIIRFYIEHDYLYIFNKEPITIYTKILLCEWDDIIQEIDQLIAKHNVLTTKIDGNTNLEVFNNSEIPNISVNEDIYIDSIKILKSDWNWLVTRTKELIEKYEELVKISKSS